TLPGGEFDCLLVTQTLQFIFDTRRAVVQMHRALRPAGIVLLTVPGISAMTNPGSTAAWYWSFTPHSMHRLFADVFGGGNVRVEAHGNVYAATAFLQGMAVEEVDIAKLCVEDAAYPVIVTVRAQKTAGTGDGIAATDPPAAR